MCGKGEEGRRGGGAGGVQHGEEKGRMEWGVTGRRSNEKQSVY